MGKDVLSFKHVERNFLTDYWGLLSVEKSSAWWASEGVEKRQHLLSWS